MWDRATATGEVNESSAVSAELVIEEAHRSVTGAGRSPWGVKFEV
jgi:hypothetical protein